MVSVSTYIVVIVVGKNFVEDVTDPDDLVSGFAVVVVVVVILSDVVVDYYYIVVTDVAAYAGTSLFLLLFMYIRNI